MQTVKDVLPYASQLMTAIIAAIAIIATRRSTKQTLDLQIEQRLWEQRTKLYVEIIDNAKKLNPYGAPTLDDREEETEENDGPAPMLAMDINSDDWHSFETRVDAFASDDILSLYQLWRSSLNEYTWKTAKALAHRDPSSEHHAESLTQYETVQEAVHTAQELLIEHVRAELRFRPMKLPKILVKPGISGVQEIVSVSERKPGDAKS